MSKIESAPLAVSSQMIKTIPEVTGLEHQMLVGIESCSQDLCPCAAGQLACVCSAWGRGLIWLFKTLASLLWGQRSLDGLASLSGPFILGEASFSFQAARKGKQELLVP